MDLTNERKYIKKLFKNDKKLEEAREILKETYNIDSELKDGNVLVIKSGNHSKFELLQLKNKLYESLDKDFVQIVFE